MNANVNKILHLKSTSCVDKDLKLSKVPGYDLIINRVLKNLSNKILTFVTALFNSLYHSHWPLSLQKVGQMIMSLETDKAPNNISSYRPISLLPAISRKIITQNITTNFNSGKINTRSLV